MPDLDQSITLQDGNLQLLRTSKEIDAQHQTIAAYFCEVPARSIGQTLQTLKSIPHTSHTSLLHLRRVVDLVLLPDHIQKRLALTPQSTCTSCEPRRIVLLGPCSSLSLEQLWNFLHTFLPRLTAEDIHVCIVPAHPPSSPDHAAKLSGKYWPTIFTNSNRFGPHHSLVSRTTADWLPTAARWMSVAWHVAKGPGHGRAGEGLPIATILVERDAYGSEVIVAAARDVRFAGLGSSMQRGNPAGHSVMRVIDLVAHKRRQLASSDGGSKPVNAPEAGSSPFAHSSSKSESASESLPTTAARPSTDPDFGTRVSDTSGLQADGYLCVNLRVYTTHEPCVMCCMALIHSRVEGVVFSTAMPQTGGFGVKAPANVSESGNEISPSAQEDQGLYSKSCFSGLRSEPQAGGCGDSYNQRAGYHADVSTIGRGVGQEGDDHSLKYDLFWNDNLNWRFPCWQWCENEATKLKSIRSNDIVMLSPDVSA